MPDCVTEPMEPSAPSSPVTSSPLVLDISRAPNRIRDSVIIAHSNPDDHIFKAIRNTAWFYEADLLAALEKRLRPGDLVVDVGANIGNHTLFFAAVCGCRVIAIEPNPTAFTLLEENVRVNGLEDKVQTLNVALGATPGMGHIKLVAEHNLGSAELVEDSEGSVRIDTLDNICGEISARLVKLDAEGFEAAIISGGMTCLSTTRATVSAEARDEASFIQVASLLETLGYVCVETRAATPTHIFDIMVGADSQHILAALGRTAAINSILIRNLTTRLASQVREHRRLQHRVAELARR